MAGKRVELSTYFVSLLKSITTIHGTSQCTSKKGKSLLLWSAAIFTNVILTILFIIIVQQKFNENQVVTGINPNCKVNQVPFPAVSICNFNMVSFRESRNIAGVLKHYGVNEIVIHDFFNDLYKLRHFGKNSVNVDNYTEVLHMLKHHFYTMDTILEEVHQKCENLLRFCMFNRKPKKCEDMIVLIKTYEGHCCAFNYAALNDASEVPLMALDQDLEYYDDQDSESGDESSMQSRIIANSVSGRLSGLTVVFNVEPEDYPSWSLVRYYGVKVLISDPNDYPETTVLYRYISLGESVEIKVEPMVFQSDANVRRVDPAKRACWFHDEIILGHTNRYSYETCYTECKMKMYLDFCKCVPYKYPRDKSIRICEFEDLKCLNNVTVTISEKEMRCKPVCYMECRDKKYRLTSDLTPFDPDSYPEEVTKGLNVSNLASLQVYFGKSTCSCYKLQLLIDVNYFIATYGGVFSLSFGGSVITLLELTYLFVSFVTTAAFRAVEIILHRNRINAF